MTTILTTTIRNSFLLFLVLQTSILNAVPAEFLTFETHRIEGKIHQTAESLESLYLKCKTMEFQSASNAGICAIVRNERVQAAGPTSQFSEMKAIEALRETFEAGAVPSEERLFIQMRLYAYLPRPYGQNFGKSLVALESLKRLKPGTPHLLFYEKEIRLLQGKEIPGEEVSRSEKSSIFDEKSFGWSAGLQYLFRLGLLGRVGYRDDSLNDGPWGMHAQVFASTRPVFGGSGGLKFSHSGWELGSGLRYSNGREDFYGLSADSPSTYLDTRIQRLDLLATYDYFVTNDTSIQAGVKVRDIRVTEPLESYASLVGPYIGITLEELSHRVSMYGYFHRYQQFGFEGQAFIPLGSKTQLNLSSFFETQFGSVLPFTHLKLGETYFIPGAPGGRYHDRTLVGGWGEFRHEVSPGLGAGVFGSGSFVGDTFDDCFKHRTLMGFGAFVDWRWTRYPRSDSRIEVSRFADETLFQVGISQSL